MEAAVKLAERAAGPKRPKIVYAENSFHGKTKGVLSITDGALYRGEFALTANTVRVPFGDIEAIEAAFKGHGSLKHVWVVDTDVDIYDPAQVEWAFATRFQGDKNMMLFANQPGSSLDPSGIHVPGQKSHTAKLGFDCTIPWGADKAKFTRGEYGRVNLEAYLP